MEQDLLCPFLGVERESVYARDLSWYPFWVSQEVMDQPKDLYSAMVDLESNEDESI